MSKFDNIIEKCKNQKTIGTHLVLGELLRLQALLEKDRNRYNEKLKELDDRNRSLFKINSKLIEKNKKLRTKVGNK